MLGPIFGMTEFKIFADELNKSLKNLQYSIINIGSIYGILSPDNSIYTDTARNNSEIYGATKVIAPSNPIQIIVKKTVGILSRNLKMFIF